MRACPAPAHAIPRRLAVLAGPALVLGGLVTGGAMLAGCAAQPAGAASTPVAAAAASAAPVTGPSARLLLRGAVPGPDRFTVFLLTDAEACKAPRMLASGTPQQAPAAATLPAGVSATLSFVVSRDNKASCESIWSFTPGAGKTYVMAGAVVGAGCNVRLLDATVPDRPVLAPGAVPRSAPGQRCLALDEARRRYASVAATGTAAVQGGQVDGEAVLNPGATAQDLRGLITP